MYQDGLNTVKYKMVEKTEHPLYTLIVVEISGEEMNETMTAMTTTMTTTPSTVLNKKTWVQSEEFDRRGQNIIELLRRLRHSTKRLNLKRMLGRRWKTFSKFVCLLEFICLRLPQYFLLFNQYISSWILRNTLVWHSKRRRHSWGCLNDGP